MLLLEHGRMISAVTLVRVQSPTETGIMIPTSTTRVDSERVGTEVAPMHPPVGMTPLGGAMAEHLIKELHWSWPLASTRRTSLTVASVKLHIGAQTEQCGVWGRVGGGYGYWKKR